MQGSFRGNRYMKTKWEEIQEQARKDAAARREVKDPVQPLDPQTRASINQAAAK